VWRIILLNLIIINYQGPDPRQKSQVTFFFENYYNLIENESFLPFEIQMCQKARFYWCFQKNIEVGNRVMALFPKKLYCTAHKG